jgi:GMP synthase-like glutamine amidotransferase
MVQRPERNSLMKPVAIFRHSPTEGPGYFADWLSLRGHSWQLVRIDECEAVPDGPEDFAGLVFMGGPMSVNDPLPWIPQVLSLIRKAVSSEVPVLGHCLGGQLMAKALGATVTRNPVKEIGWGPVTIREDPLARHWFGETREFLSFHWHGETFALPPAARLIASSAYCDHQAFALGPHLGMQCHVEMTPSLIRSWCRDWHKEVTSLASRVASVQTPEEIEKDLDRRVQALHRVADVLYERWAVGLRR